MFQANGAGSKRVLKGGNIGVLKNGKQSVWPECSEERSVGHEMRFGRA